MYASPEPTLENIVPRVSSASGFVLGALTGLLLWFGVYPGPLLKVIRAVFPA
jgi:hypothetical protein